MYESEAAHTATRLVSLAAAGEQGELWELVDQVTAGDSARETLLALSLLAAVMTMAEAEHCNVSCVDELLMVATTDPQED